MNKKTRRAKLDLQAPKAQGGVLLLEVMIAIMIFSFGLLGLVGLQVTSTQNSSNAEERTRASLLANDMVSMLWARQTLNNANVSTDIATWQAQVTAASTSGMLPNAVGTVDRTDKDGNVSATGNYATITVQWRAVSKKATDKNQYVTTIAMKS